MTDDGRPPHDDFEEAPFVLGLLMRAQSGLEGGVRRLVASLGRRLQLFVWGAGTAVVFLGIAALSIAQSPTFGGIGRGLAAGIFTALLFAAGFGWLLLWANGSRTRLPADDTGAVTELNAMLAPTLRELNAVRRDVLRQVKVRSISRVPIGVAAAFALWLVSQTTDDPPGFLGLIMFLVAGAVGGEMWAAHKLERDYRRLYKDRVLPHLAARLGNLTYRAAAPGDVARVQAQRILPESDSIEADDAIAGTYRGLALSIVETRLRRSSGEKTQVVFDGLLIEVTLPRSLTGTTVVITDQGVFGNLKTRLQRTGLQPVRLEDAAFEKKYEVYSSDQIESRALLTPAFMERFVALASRSGFSLPGAMAEGNRLAVALPKSLGTGDLFEPPVYWKPAGGRVLLMLEQDIRAVLAMADTVIGLDFWATGRAAHTGPHT